MIPAYVPLADGEWRSGGVEGWRRKGVDPNTQILHSVHHTAVCSMLYHLGFVFCMLASDYKFNIKYIVKSLTFGNFLQLLKTYI